MSIRQVEFADLERQINRKSNSVLRYLAPDFGKTYVVAISRDNCPACKKQKPKLDKLAREITKKHGDSVVFIRIHVRQPRGNNSESVRAKDMLKHYFYPTNLILFKTQDRGAIEYYRNSSPRMTELRRNVEVAQKVAQMLAKEKT